MIIPSIYRQKINILWEFFLRIGQKIYFSIFPIRSFTERLHLLEKPIVNGLPVLTLNADGELQCNACLICQKICPTKCIKINSNADKVISFELNMLQCIDCNLCEQRCPIDAIRFTQERCTDITQAQMNLEILAYRKTLNSGMGIKTAVARRV